MLRLLMVALLARQARGMMVVLSDEIEEQPGLARQAMKEQYNLRLASNASTVRLNNGLFLPLVGLGTSLKNNSARAFGVRQMVEYSVRAGYRHVDTALSYGVEQEVGAALRTIFKEGIVARDDLWISSKLPNYSHKFDDVEKTLDVTLNHLGLEYLDLYLIHWPAASDEFGMVLSEPTLEETWRAMEKLVDSGKVKTIGLSNFSPKKIQDILRIARIMPAVLQCEVHPKFRQDFLLEYAAHHHIHVTAYAPLGSSDQPWNHQVHLMQLDEVKDIAKDLDKTTGQILLRWGIQRGTSVIPKSSTPSHIASNLDIFDFTLTDHHMRKLSLVEPQHRIYNGGFMIQNNGVYPTTHDYWDTNPQGDYLL